MPTVPNLRTRSIHVQRPRRNLRKLVAARSAVNKRQMGRPPLMGAEDGSLHPFDHLPPILTGIAPHRRRCIRYYKLTDAMVEKGNGAYLLTVLDCVTTNHRHLRFGPAI
ncbi:helicase-like protein [Trypanosoma cruzi]|nr:helicase-like protein [Trypanosoma cruzi]